MISGPVIFAAFALGYMATNTTGLGHFNDPHKVSPNRPTHSKQRSHLGQSFTENRPYFVDFIPHSNRAGPVHTFHTDASPIHCPSSPPKLLPCRHRTAYPSSRCVPGVLPDRDESLSTPLEVRGLCINAGELRSHDRVGLRDW